MRELLELFTDEVSLVDNPANEFAKVTLHKRHEEERVSNTLTFRKGEAPPPGSRQALERELDARLRKVLDARPGLARARRSCCS